mgnify:CR=1 FL=1
MSVLNDPDCGWIKNIPKRTNVKTLTVHKGKAITFDTSDIERPTLLVP